ncbi:MAG: hypothetical protein E7425_07790 [Ruminococcaceae bacterium]|nr:hypothetical protein [Oscillospiraceae bacterium]
MHVVTNKLRGGEKSSVIVGSGYLYAIDADTIENPFDMSAEDVDKLIEIGYIQGDATLKATAASVDLTTANYGKIGKIYSDKEVTFTTGIISWNLDNVSKFLTGSKFETAASGSRYYYGVDDNAPKVLLKFIADDQKEGKTISIVMPIAQFQGELEMNFSAENPVSFNYAFDLMTAVDPADKKSYYFYVDEENVEDTNDPDPDPNNP